MTGGARQATDVIDYLAAARWDVFREEPGHSGTAELPGNPIASGVSVPTTAAAIVAGIEGERAARERDYDSDIWWFRSTVDVPAQTDVRLECAGLATICEVWVDGALIAESESMFAPLRVTLRSTGDRMTIALRFRSLSDHLARRRPRGRWRSAMIAAQGLRWVRTTMLGRAPVYHGVPAPVGPWRPLTLTATEHARTPPRLRGQWRDGVAVLRVHADVAPGAEVTIEVGETPATMTSATATADADGRLDTTVTLAGLSPWWPHTHGAPVRHPVRITDPAGTVEYLVGFRDISVDRAGGGFALSVNGIRIFCRGACWVPVDLLGFGAAGMREQLEAVRAAGANMIRVVGTMVYESPQFYDLCSELGILVWQDLMVATVDPPSDESFLRLLRAEIDAFVEDNGYQAALAVISGGSETDQQPTMLGLSADESRIPFSEKELPEIIERESLGVGYLPSSPTGGDLATHEGAGVAHYFGIGGYLRPLDDVRAARVRFAAESLAFSVPPERRSVDALFGSAAPAGHDPDWKRGVPRDRGSSWDFEDVRDHYVRTLFGVEPSLVRRDDPEYYLDLGRAAICEAVSAAYSYWRGTDSGCDGALVLALRDTGPGAGWGLVDILGVPKAPWYPWARAAAPVAILLDDRGLDGLRITVPNDRPTELTARLVVTLHTMTGLVPTEGAVEITIPGHGSWSGTVDGVLGRFTDATHAHRFGRRGYEAVVVRLVGTERVGPERVGTERVDPGRVGREFGGPNVDGPNVDGTDVDVAPAVHLVGGPQLPLQVSVGLTARCATTAHGWTLRVAATGVAQYVVIDCPGYQPADNWFHLAPGTFRDIPLRPVGSSAKPSGRVRALNAVTAALIEVVEATGEPSPTDP